MTAVRRVQFVIACFAFLNVAVFSLREMLRWL